MIPILYPETEAAYDNLGIGPIEATSCVVTEELNGAYTLKMTVPVSTPHLKDLVVNNQILAKPNPYDQPQPFRIGRVSKRLRDAIDIYAPHLCYDLRFIPVGSSAVSPTTTSEILTLLNAQTGQNNFIFSAAAGVNVGEIPLSFDAPLPAWDVLGGSGNSITGHRVTADGLEAKPYELYFDRRSVVLYHSTMRPRGADRGFSIDYGVNLTDLTLEIDAADAYTAVESFWRQSGSQRVGDAVQIRDAGNAERIFMYDATSRYSSRPSVASLNNVSSAEIRKNPTGGITVQTKLGAVPPGARGFDALEVLQLGDKIKVNCALLSAALEARVVAYSYDALLERYMSLDVEGRLTGAATTIARIARGKKAG